MSISRGDLAAWIEAEFAEYLTATGLEAGNGDMFSDFGNAITKSLREMGLNSVDSLTDDDATQIYDLVELYALERILDALAVRVDFTADGSSVKLSMQHAACLARYERQKRKCESAWGLSGAVVARARTMTMGALTEESTEYSWL